MKLEHEKGTAKKTILFFKSSSLLMVAPIFPFFIIILGVTEICFKWAVSEVIYFIYR
jgi:hypothetical protein